MKARTTPRAPGPVTTQPRARPIPLPPGFALAGAEGPGHSSPLLRKSAVTDGEPAGGALAASSLDRVNRAAWRSGSVYADYTSRGGDTARCWSDPGERAVLLSVASATRGSPILDLGVGTGRTIPMLSLLSDDYVGIDYTPEMIAVCRQRFPNMDVRLGDARDLRDFESQQFGLVLFSFNGLDAVDHNDRLLALSEIHRVLRPGGLFVFSTHNKSGPCFMAPPWRPAGAPGKDAWPRRYRVARVALSLLSDPGHYPRSLRNWRLLRRLAVDAGTWGVSTVEAHDFDLLIHFVTLPGERAELRAAGFELDAAFDCEHGAPLDLDDEPTEVRYFQLVARTTAPAAPVRPSGV